MDTITFSSSLKIPAEFLPVRWALQFCCQGWRSRPTTGCSTPSSAGWCWPVSGLGASGWLGPGSSDPTDRSGQRSPRTVWAKEGKLSIQADRRATEFTVIQSSSWKMKTLFLKEPCTSQLLKSEVHMWLNMWVFLQRPTMVSSPVTKSGLHHYCLLSGGILHKRGSQLSAVTITTVFMCTHTGTQAHRDTPTGAHTHIGTCTHRNIHTGTKGHRDTPIGAHTHTGTCTQGHRDTPTEHAHT